MSSQLAINSAQLAQHGRIAEVLTKLTEAGIDLVEWEDHLHTRLGVPLASSRSRCFLVPDQQLASACQIIASLGHSTEPMDILEGLFTSEITGLVKGFVIDKPAEKSFDDPQKGFLMPMSWTGLTLNDLEPLKLRNTCMPGRPFKIWTVPIAATCTAMIRIIGEETVETDLCRRMENDLTNLMDYNLYDLSYEGQYLDIPGNNMPLSEAEELEIKNAASTVKSWEMRQGEEWIGQVLVQTVLRNDLWIPKYPREKMKSIYLRSITK